MNEFPSLSFEGRTALRVEEVAARLNVTSQHVLDLVEEGKIKLDSKLTDYLTEYKIDTGDKPHNVSYRDRQE